MTSISQQQQPESVDIEITIGGRASQKNYNNRPDTVLPIYRLGTSGTSINVYGKLSLGTCVSIEPQVLVQAGIFYRWISVIDKIDFPLFTDIRVKSNCRCFVQNNRLYISPIQSQPKSFEEQELISLHCKFRLNGLSKENVVGRLSNLELPIYRLFVCVSREGLPNYYPIHTVFGISNFGDYKTNNERYADFIVKLGSLHYLRDLILNKIEGDFKKEMQIRLNNLGERGS
jgi:hypothetical protein